MVVVCLLIINFGLTAIIIFQFGAQSNVPAFKDPIIIGVDVLYADVIETAGRSCRLYENSTA